MEIQEASIRFVLSKIKELSVARKAQRGRGTRGFQVSIHRVGVERSIVRHQAEHEKTVVRLLPVGR